MPLFFQQQVNKHTRLGVWKIEEPETFFSAHVPLQRSITHGHKRLQHLAGRYLLKHLFPEFPLALIQIADTRKPFLRDELFHFSLSHCGDFAAALVSRRNRVGVDIEIVSDKVQRVQHKFVSKEEMGMVNGEWSVVSNKTPISPLTTHHSLLTLIWSCKEAVFKWYGKGEVDFKKHMQVQGVETGENKLFQTAILFTKKEGQSLGLQSRFFDGLCVSYIVT
jgi:phosphopantetheinyl transferase